VAFVYENETKTPGFEHAQKLGEEQLKQELPCAEVTAVESVAEGPGAEQIFAQLADEGNDLIFGLSFGYADQILAVAEQYPNVKFEHALGFQQAENVSTFYGAVYESWYLAGIAAARQVPSGKLGFVAPFPIPASISEVNAFALGAQSVNPDATVQLVYTNDFEDPVKDRQAAGALVDEGVEVLGQATGSPSVGEVAVTEDVAWIGSHDPAVETFGPETFLAAPYLQWGVYFIARAQDVIDDNWKSQNYFGTIGDDFVELALSEGLPAPVTDEVEGKKQEIADGSLVVFAGPIKDQSGKVIVPEGETGTFDTMSTTLVEGVIGEIPQG
jgi:basic membrane protein A